MLKNLKIWLSEHLPQLLFWRKQDSSAESVSDSWLEMPVNLKNQLIEQIDNLENNFAEQDAIALAIAESYEKWQQNPEGVNNSVVILGSPITSVSRILTTSLEDWAKEKEISLKLLPLKARPHTLEKIKSELEQLLGQRSPVAEEQQITSEIVIIPNLSWYFLRSLEGLEGIEYLRFLLSQNVPNRFWIIGVNHIAWEYFKLVFHLEAYCGEVVTISKLSAKDLESWLDPIVERLNITYGTPRIDQKLLKQDLDRKTHYFERLAEVSEGISTIAAKIFFQSIQYLEEEKETETEFSYLIAQVPEAPNLSILESVDQYILYSLLLHDDITFSALAISLGDEESEVRARIFGLINQNVLERKGNTLVINHLYYPQIKQQLKSSNFIIEQE